LGGMFVLYIASCSRQKYRKKKQTEYFALD